MRPVTRHAIACTVLIALALVRPSHAVLALRECSEVTCLETNGHDYTFFPVDSESNEFTHMRYSFTRLSEQTSAGVAVNEITAFDACTVDATVQSHGGAVSVTTVHCPGVGLSGVELLVDIMQALEDVTMVVRGADVKLEKGNFKLAPTVRWPHNAAANHFKVSVRMAWDLPQGVFDVVDAGINSIPRRGIKDFGYETTDAWDNVVMMDVNAVFKLHLDMPTGVQVCGTATRPSCWRTMATEHDFEDFVDVVGMGDVEQAPTSAVITHKWNTVTRTMSFDPVFSMEEGQLIKGPYSLKTLVFAGIGAVVLVCCCFCLTCYCCCCKKKKVQNIDSETYYGGGGGGGGYGGHGGGGTVHPMQTADVHAQQQQMMHQYDQQQYDQQQFGQQQQMYDSYPPASSAPQQSYPVGEYATAPQDNGQPVP